MDWIATRARIIADKTAIIDIEKKRTLSFQSLNERAGRWAYFLQEQGIQKGDRLAVITYNQAEVFELLFACGKIGAIFVPLNWRLSVEELRYIINNCAPKLILYHEEFAGKIIAVDGKKFSLQEVAIDSYPTQYVPVKISETDPWLMIYTGGTTGRPKGVILSHRAVDWNALNTIVSWGLSPDDITLNYMPLFHTGGINALCLPILMNGGTVVIGNQFDPKEALRYLHEYQCTIALFVPTMYHMMLQTEEFEKLDFPTMKVFLSGGAPCPLAIYERFFAKGLDFKEGYGLTEAGPNNFFISPDDAKRKPGSVGKPMMFNEVKIKTFDGRDAKPGEVGELLIRGNHCFSGYWQNEEATAEVWKDDWLYTGDLAKKDEDGYFYIVGRKKDMIISGGENIFPGEVEQVLDRHPAVDEVAVVGLPDEKWGEVVTAFVSQKSGYRLDGSELARYCKGKIASYKIPKRFVFLPELPKTPVGKIDKKALINMNLKHEQI